MYRLVWTFDYESMIYVCTLRITRTKYECWFHLSCNMTYIHRLAFVCTKKVPQVFQYILKSCYGIYVYRFSFYDVTLFLAKYVIDRMWSESNWVRIHIEIVLYDVSLREITLYISVILICLLIKWLRCHVKDMLLYGSSLNPGYNS